MKTYQKILIAIAAVTIATLIVYSVGVVTVMFMLHFVLKTYL